MRKTLEERFWKKVNKTDTCWNWTAGGRGRGYGYIKIVGRGFSAHRVAWEMHNGSIPYDLCVLHKCDNRGCVNPTHLFLGTNLDNVNDKMAKGRHIITPCFGESNGASKLTISDVTEIREKYASGGYTQLELANEYGISQPVVSRAVHKKTWNPPA